MKQPKYLFYPSLLDSFLRYIVAEDNAEDFFWQDENGAWHKNLDEGSGELHYTPSEVEALARKELIDKINRVQTEPSEAASKGTALNEIVDSFVTRRRSERVTMCGDKSNDTIHAEIDGFAFNFSYKFVEEVAGYFANAIPQVRVDATIDTKYGIVGLYGYIDYLRYNHVYDMKTTKTYTYGDHEDGMQRYVYPYCLLESGMVTDVQDFEYTCYQWRGGGKREPNLYGIQYKEVYTYDHEHAKLVIKQVCERFIEFLELYKDDITDKKVFGESEQPFESCLSPFA